VSVSTMIDPTDILSVQASAAKGPLAVATMVMFLHQMSTGSSLGYAGLVFPHHTSSSSSLLHLTLEQATWLVSISPLAMNLGIFLSIPLSDLLGRKKMFLLSNTSSLLGYLAMFLAPSFPCLLAARAFQCAGMGLADVAPAVYLAEVSTVRLRGPISGCNMTASVAGTLFYTALCIVLPIELLSVAFMVHHAVVVLLVLGLPESPQWLVGRGREEEAGAALQRLRGAAYQGVKLEVEELRRCCRTEDAPKESVVQALRNKAFTVPLATFTVVFMCVGLAGTDTLVFYGPTIFEQIDIGLAASTLTTLPWVGFTLGYALSSPLMDRLDRVPQFVTFSSIMAVSMSCLGAMVVLLEQGVGPVVVEQVVLLASLLLATTAYGLGVGAVAYTMLGEVFLPSHRNMGTAMAQLVRGATMFLLSSLVPTVITSLGLHTLFLGHGTVCALAAAFVWRFVPETRGKTLSQLCRLYGPTEADSRSQADTESYTVSDTSDTASDTVSDTASDTSSHIGLSIRL